MLAIIFTVLPAAFFVWGLTMTRAETWADYNTLTTLGWTFVIPCGLILLVNIVIWICAYSGAVQTRGWLLGKAHSIPSYQKVARKINDLAALVNKANGDGDDGYILDAANLEQSTNASNAIVAYRNAIDEFNTTLMEWRAWHNNWFTRFYVCKMPDELHMLEVDL